MFKYILAAMLIVMSHQAFGLNCKSQVEQQLVNQLDNSKLFKNRQAIVVVVICAQKPLPVFFMLQTKLMSKEKLETTITPMTTLVNVKLPLNPNGKTKATGFLAVDRDYDNRFTLRLRTRLATGEAIDIGKDLELSPGKSMVFEDSNIQVGVVRLGE